MPPRALISSLTVVLASAAVACATTPRTEPPRAAPVVVPAATAEPSPAPTAPRTSTRPAPAPDAAEWLASEPAAVARARREHRPLLVSFGAAWCGACLELAKRTYSDAGFVSISRRFVLLEIDATDDESPAVRELIARYGVRGLPTIIVIDSGSKERARFLDFVGAEALVGTLEQVR